MYKIKTTALLKKVMHDYFACFANAPKVAWCTSVGPAELLRSFGFEVYFPENHGALLGATRTAGDYIPAAVRCGFSSDICSYTTSDIGAFLNKETPLQKHYGLKSIPKPDLIVYNTNQCREVEEWFTFYANHYKCPIAGIHPPRYLDEVSKNEIDLVVQQFKKMIPVCEDVSGNKFDIDNFGECLKLSNEATLLWQKVLQTAKASPSPLSFFDGTIHMGPIVILRGTQQATDYYQALLNELEDNVKKGIGFLDREESRIFWDGMPIWGKLRTLSDLFAENNAAVVASTYCNSWIFDNFDEKKPFESSALAYTQIFINRSEKAKMEFFKSWIEEYDIDGIIFHDAKTCFNNSNARFGLPLRLKEETGIPYLVIEGDLCDLRFFSEGQSITKIETFIEQLESQKVLNEYP
ncbi:MAG: 2-hydroxyacyl-CoA dehydratase [Cytophagales bacterium]|nr:2-hydroxyacyl-CoA dehydratase [Cytophagales bacterium]